jgi:FkbM family methyltransferase
VKENKTRKILLINTSFSKKVGKIYSNFGVPLGLLTIASALQQNGYSVDMVDPQIEFGYLKRIRRLLKKKPVLVGLSTYQGENTRNALEIASFIKRENHSMPIVLGGPMATSIPKVFLEQIDADYVVMGTGEETIVKLAEALRLGRDPGQIPNISYKFSGEIKAGEIYSFDGNLDELPLPNLELWKKGINISHNIPILTSRGCPRRCAFCYNSFTGKYKYYLRSKESVIAEMERWSRYFNCTTFHFVDDNFLLDPERALSILNEVNLRGWKVRRLMGHLNEFDRIPLERLTPAVTDVIMCIESASTRMQDILNKKIDIEKALKLVAGLSSLNIHFLTAFMFGLPTETDEDMRQSVLLADRIRAINSSNVSMCYIYAPQPRDRIINRTDIVDGTVDFSIDSIASIEVVPVLPDDTIDLRLRPWMKPADVPFYLNFVKVWQYHFDRQRFREAHPDFDLAACYARDARVRNMFRDIYPDPVKGSYFQEPRLRRERNNKPLDSFKRTFPDQLCLYDLGAAKGTLPPFRFLKNEITMVNFEPDRRSTTAEGGINLPLAIGPANFNTIYLNRRPTTSSLLQPNRKIVDRYDWRPVFGSSEDVFETIAQEPVETIPLGRVVEERCLPKPDFVKIDVQGLSYEVLEGIDERLWDYILGLTIETEFIKTYTGQKTIGYINNLLEKKGFEIFRLFNLCKWYYRTKIPLSTYTGQDIFCDLVYFRSISSIADKPELWDANKARRMLALLLLHDLTDASAAYFEKFIKVGIIDQTAASSIEKMISSWTNAADFFCNQPFSDERMEPALRSSARRILSISPWQILQKMRSVIFRDYY